MRREVLPLTLLLLALSCSTTQPVQTVFLDDQYRISPSSLFHYRSPTGWVEPARTEEHRGAELWLVSPDFHRSMEIREVHLDGQERPPQESVPEVSRLLLDMMSEDGKGAANGLTSFVADGRTYWSFEAGTRGGVTQRVTVFAVGEKMIEMRVIWRQGTDERGMRLLQEEFLRALQW